MLKSSCAPPCGADGRCARVAQCPPVAIGGVIQGAHTGTYRSGDSGRSVLDDCAARGLLGGLARRAPQPTFGFSTRQSRDKRERRGSVAAFVPGLG